MQEEQRRLMAWLGAISRERDGLQPAERPLLAYSRELQVRHMELMNLYGEETVQRWIAKLAAGSDPPDNYGYPPQTFATRTLGLHPEPPSAPPSSAPVAADSSPRDGYSRLEQHQFRLLELLPGNFGEIWIAIHQYDSFSGVNYTALSWTWGQTTMRQPIFVKDWRNEILVPPNCIDALKQLRYTNRSRNLWIVAICINQRDEVEKSYQIAMMGHIYRNARTVVAYVGEVDSAVQYMMQLIPKRSTKIDKTIVQRFLDRPYFSRVWVIQEVAFALNLVLRAGGMEMAWETFESLCHLAGYIDDSKEPFGARPHNLMEMRRWYKGQENIAERQGWSKARIQVPAMTKSLPSIGVLKESQLSEVLRMTREFKATLNKDKYFALVPLFDDKSLSDTAIDYQATGEDLYQGLSKNFERNHNASHVSLLAFPKHKNMAAVPDGHVALCNEDNDDEDEDHDGEDDDDDDEEDDDDEDNDEEDDYEEDDDDGVCVAQSGILQSPRYLNTSYASSIDQTVFSSSTAGTSFPISASTSRIADWSAEVKSVWKSGYEDDDFLSALRQRQCSCLSGLDYTV